MTQERSRNGQKRQLDMQPVVCNSGRHKYTGVSSFPGVKLRQPCGMAMIQY